MATSEKTLRETTAQVVRDYLSDMGPVQATNLHKMILAEIEPALITEVLNHTQGNQSKAAQILGITRNTLRSKIKLYQISPK